MTIRGLLEKQAAARPGAAAMRFFRDGAWRTRTYGETLRGVREIAEGYGRAFGHALGHGVGYEVHERPTARAGDKTILKPGMLVTIEPGIYLVGDTGVRVEDLVLVTGDGVELLNRYSHELDVIE